MKRKSSKSKKQMIRVQVTAHHRNEDFRPYTIRFADKGGFKENLAHALVKAIMKEGEWMGWFHEEGQLRGLEKEIETKVTELIMKGDPKTKMNFITIFGYDPYDDVDQTAKITDVAGLVVWVDETDKHFKNYGFGWGTRRHPFDGKIDEAPLSDRHTDKNDNRWVEFLN